MAALDKQTVYIAAGVLGVALVAAYLLKKAAAGGIGGVASGAAGAAVNAAAGAATGTVVAIGQQFGIPATSQSQCDIDMAAGDTWAASFSCPLPTFAKYVANGFKPPEAPSAAATVPVAYQIPKDFGVIDPNAQW